MSEIHERLKRAVAATVDAKVPDDVANDVVYQMLDFEYERGAQWGAGWAFAIVGMAQAIRDFCEHRALVQCVAEWRCAWCNEQHLGRCRDEALRQARR